MKKFIICAFCALCGFTTASAQKFGHLDTQSIIQSMPEYTAATTELEKLAKQYEDDQKAMQDEMQKKVEAYEKEAQTLPKNIKDRREQELNELYNRLQESVKSNQAAFQQAQQEKLQAIHGKLLDAIKAVGQEGGYVYIMEMGAGIPYISTTLSTDVTAQVKAKLGLK